MGSGLCHLEFWVSSLGCWESGEPTSQRVWCLWEAWDVWSCCWHFDFLALLDFRGQQPSAQMTSITSLFIARLSAAKCQLSHRLSCAPFRRSKWTRKAHLHEALGLHWPAAQPRLRSYVSLQRIKNAALSSFDGGDRRS